LLRDVSLSVAPGEVIVIVGPSGSGKTSLIRLLCGLLQREAGGWEVTGTLRAGTQAVDLSHGDSQIGGMVFQNHALFDDLNAGENLRIVADHTTGDILELSRNTGAMLADIDPAQSIMSCSGGQRQRLAIARTLLSDPALLLFDEPNAGLDVRGARWLVGLIRDLCRQSNKPAIIVAHHVDDFISLADRVLLLDPSTATLREVAVDREAIEAAMLAVGSPHGIEGDQPQAPDVASAKVNPWVAPLQRRSRTYWFMRYFGEYMWMLFASPSMLFYAVLGSSIVGFVTEWFGFNYHSFGGYLRAILHDRLRTHHRRGAVQHLHSGDCPQQRDHRCRSRESRFRHAASGDAKSASTGTWLHHRLDHDQPGRRIIDPGRACPDCGVLHRPGDLALSVPRSGHGLLAGVFLPQDHRRPHHGDLGSVDRVESVAQCLAGWRRRGAGWVAAVAILQSGGSVDCHGDHHWRIADIAGARVTAGIAILIECRIAPPPWRGHAAWAMT
jgi:ABC-type transporter Mla maintaining outer membrane lipid asymmetry ATPase subunit MlaF